MNTQQRLEAVAQRYRRQGYQVTLNPGAVDLPDFAKEFKVEILATGPVRNVLISAKESTRDFRATTRLSPGMRRRSRNSPAGGTTFSCLPRRRP